MKTSIRQLSLIFSILIFSACTDGLPEGLVTIDFNETVEYSRNRSILFKRVLEESRCPRDSYCGFAGQVRIELEIETETGTEIIELSKVPNIIANEGVKLGTQTFNLTKVEPYPDSFIQIDSTAYSIELLIE